MCGKYTKNKSEIRKRKAKNNVILVLFFVVAFDISNLSQKRQTQNNNPFSG